MTDLQQADIEREALTDELIGRAEALVPTLRERAREGEELRHTPQEVVEQAIDAQLIEALVPRRWGGLGLGLRSLTQVARVLAGGDVSAAWTISFLMEHNWMACHLPWEAQEQIYADKPYILAAAPLHPGGTATRVDGGFLVSGTWRYASGIWNSDWCFVTSLVEEGGEKVPYTFLVPRSELTVHDEWFFAGMAATGSTNLSGEDVFVADIFSIQTALFHSADQHPGAAHEESLMRYPIIVGLYTMVAGIALGAGEATIELGRDRVWNSAVWGVNRIDQPLSRSRWGDAHQKVRCARFLYDAMLETTIAKADAGQEWDDAEVGQQALDRLTVAHLCKDAARLIIDGAGSSAYDLSNPLQRYVRDIDVLANHLGHDWDNVIERTSRYMLGYGRLPIDPFPPAPRREQ